MSARRASAPPGREASARSRCRRAGRSRRQPRLAYDFHGKSRGLELKDILDVRFQAWLADFERGVSGLSNSTGNLMRDMVLRGPSTFDGLFVYESVVIDYLKSAEGRC